MGNDNLSGIVIGAAIEVHRSLGPGLLESAYEECLAYELRHLGLEIERQKAIPIVFKEVKLECGYRIDLLMEKKIVLEVKSNRGDSSGSRSTTSHLPSLFSYKTWALDQLQRQSAEGRGAKIRLGGSSGWDTDNTE